MVIIEIVASVNIVKSQLTIGIDFDIIYSSKRKENNMTIYILTRVDVDYCARCDKFNTYNDAIEAVKDDFKSYGFNWEDRISMLTGDVGSDSFPIREYDGGEHEWDIHRIEF